MRSSKSDLRLNATRTGIHFNGRDYSGFPFLSGMLESDQLRVAGWAQQLSSDGPNERQKRLLRREAARLHAKRRPFIAADDAVDSPLSRFLWRSLSDAEKRVVRDPNTKGCEYPLSVGDVSELTGLSIRQVQTWADSGWLPHWRDERNSRRFGPAALILGYRLSQRKQAEIQALTETFKASSDPTEIKRKIREEIVIKIKLLAVGEPDSSTTVAESEDHALEFLQDIIDEAKSEELASLSI